MTILVADDSEKNRELLRTVLGHLGHDVAEASNGREAVRLAGVAADARAHDVFPSRPAAPAARDHVVERQLRRRRTRAAILALERVAQEHVEPREGRPPRRRHVFLERDQDRKSVV